MSAETEFALRDFSAGMWNCFRKRWHGISSRSGVGDRSSARHADAIPEGAGCRAPEDDSRIFIVLLSSYFVLVVAPSFVKRLLVSRVRVVDIATDVSPTPLAANLVGAAAAVAVAIIFIYVAMTRFRRFDSSPKLWIIAYSLLLGGGIAAGGLAGLRPDAVAVNVAVVMALSLMRPRRRESNCVRTSRGCSRASFVDVWCAFRRRMAVRFRNGLIRHQGICGDRDSRWSIR